MVWHFGIFLIMDKTKINLELCRAINIYAAICCDLLYALLYITAFSNLNLYRSVEGTSRKITISFISQQRNCMQNLPSRRLVFYYSYSGTIASEFSGRDWKIIAPRRFCSYNKRKISPTSDFITIIQFLSDNCNLKCSHCVRNVQSNLNGVHWIKVLVQLFLNVPLVSTVWFLNIPVPAID